MGFKKLTVCWFAAIASVLSMLWMSVANAEYTLNLTEGVTPISRDLYGLHMIVFWICVVIGSAVFGVMVWTIFFHRKSRGAKASNFHESTKIEIIWTLVPLFVLIAVAIPATSTLLDLEDAKTDADINLQVTGIQWKWKYKFVDEDVEFISSLAQSSREAVKNPLGNENYLLEVDEPIVLPINKKIRFLFHSNDVIHSWFVPALGVKQDAIPGFINDSWTIIEKVGTYRGQCAELCGKEHGFMPIVVEAVTQADYEKWLSDKKAKALAVAASAEEKWSMEDLIAKGETVYKTNCSGCHGSTGAGIPGVFPAMTGSNIVLGDILDHIDIIVNGRAGTAMAAFKTQLSDVDIAAVVTFERNGLGNSVGDMVQPSAITGLR